MICFTEYEMFLKALRDKTVTDEERRLASVLLEARKAVVTYHRLDSSKRRFFTADDLKNLREETVSYDYISVAAARLRSVIKHIVNNLQQDIVRENVLMPLHKANEFNSRSVAWISRRPGRTVREKLSGTKSVMAVKRRMSIDTAANRLFKAVVRRMSALLQTKTNCMPKGTMPEEETELLLLCNKFLHSADAEEIGAWTNLPPNNTLLSDRYYHEVWKTWNDLKAINTLLKSDQNNFPQLMGNLTMLWLLRKVSCFFVFPQQPIFYDCESEQGNFWLNPPYKSGMTEYFIGLGENERIKITRDGGGCVTIDYGEKTRRFCFGHLSLSEEGKEIISADNFNLQSVKECLELALQNLCGKDFDKKNSEYLSPKLFEQKGKMGVVDIFAVRPRAVTDKNGTLLQERLAGLQADYGQAARAIHFSAGQSDALRFGRGITKLNTIISLVESGQVTDKIHIQNHIALLRKYVKTEQLTLIYPDCCNEFQLQAVRQIARMYYFNVRAVPKSLDVIFRMPNIPDLKNALSEREAFILLDQVSDNVSITLILPVFDEELAQRMPETDGLIWERHPVLIIDSATPHMPLSSGEEEALKFLGRDVILSEAAQLKFMTQNEEEIDLPILRIKLAGQIQDITANLKQFIAGYKKLLGNRRIHFLRLTEQLTFDEKNLGGDVTDIPMQTVGEGVFRYQALSAAAESVSLWRDYLPDISIKRMIGFFDLVKGSTIDYGLVREKEISLPDTRFTLPKGQKEYRFQLHMSNVSKKRVYEAVVRHRAFPLKEDVECELKMKYACDADNPYSLQFHAVNRQAEFSIAKVEWEPLTHYPTSELPYQNFHAEKTWEALSAFSDKNNSEQKIDIPTKLFETLSSLLNLTKNNERVVLHELTENTYTKRIYIKATFADGSKGTLLLRNKQFNYFVEKNDYAEYCKALTAENACADIIAFIDKIKGGDTGRIIEDLSGAIWDERDRIRRSCNIGGKIYDIVFSKDNFRFKSDSTKTLGRVDYYVNQSNLNQYAGRYIFARDIAFADEYTYNVRQIYFEDPFEIKFPSQLNLQKNWLLFLLHSIYGNVRNLNHVAQTQENAVYILQRLSELADVYLKIRANAKFETTKNILLQILALTNQDAGDLFYETLYDELQPLIERGEKLPYWLGYAMGGYDTPAEQWLFDYLSPLDNEGFFNILAAALWRNEDFLLNVPREVLLRYFDKAVNIFIDRHKNKSLFFGSSIRLLEIILAVFRLRTLKNNFINERLSLNNPKLNELYHCLEKMIAEKQFAEFNTRIKLNVTKSKEYAKYDMPDLVYALMVCLSGTKNENKIVILSVEENGTDI